MAPSERTLAIIFDFDGLMMDTETTNLLSWRYEWAQWGLTLDEEDFFADHGGSMVEERYQLLAETVGSTYDRPLSDQRRNTYRDELHHELGLSPGIQQWIDEATASRWALGIASSSPRGWVAEHLGRVGIQLESFHAVAFGEEVACPKPDPAVYQLVLERLAVPSDRPVAIEDTPHGVAAAKAAGIRCVAIPNRYADPTRFGQADHVVSSATQTTLRNALATFGVGAESDAER